MGQARYPALTMGAAPALFPPTSSSTAHNSSDTSHNPAGAALVAGSPQQLHPDLTMDDLVAAPKSARPGRHCALADHPRTRPDQRLQVCADRAGHSFCLCR